MILRKHWKQILKWLCYLLLLLVACAIQSSPGLGSFFGAKPMMLVPVVVSIALFEGEIASGAFGLFAGFIWDVSAGKIFGFFGMVLMVCCIAITLFSMYFIRVNITNALWLCFLTCMICGIWDFLFYYFIWGYDGAAIYLWDYLFMALYTAVLCIPVYFLVRKLVDKLNTVVRA